MLKNGWTRRCGGALRILGIAVVPMVLCASAASAQEVAVGGSALGVSARATARLVREGGSAVAVVASPSAPVIDGDLSDPAWQGAPVHGGFTQRDPDEGAPASERTEFRVVWSIDQLEPVTPDRSANGNFGIDFDANGTGDVSLGTPDFTVLSFRSNLVLRWDTAWARPCSWCGSRADPIDWTRAVSIFAPMWATCSPGPRGTCFSSK